MYSQNRTTSSRLVRWRITPALFGALTILSLSVAHRNPASAGESDQPPDATSTILIKVQANVLVSNDRQRISQSTGAISIRPLHDLASAANPAAAKSIGLDRWYELTIPVTHDLQFLANQLNQSSIIELAEIPALGTVAEEIPDDPFFELQYALHNTGQIINNRPGVIDADLDGLEAFEIHQGNGLVTVAIIDSGVDPHADYFGRLLTGYNTIEHNDNTADDCPHGTHTAGIIAAKGNNGLGIAGLNWSCNILPIRVLDGCIGSSANCAEGILFAADHPNEVAVINVSLAFYTFSQFLADAVTYAYANDILLVAAAGNSHGRTVAYPAALPEVIAVSATGNTDEFEDFSNFGPEIELAAPGRDIYSTWVGGTYTWLAGTSTASPQVAGTAALVRSFAPGLTADETRQILFATAEDLGLPGWDEKFGHGRTNAHRAVQRALQQSNQLFLYTLPQTLDAGAPVALIVEYAEPAGAVFFAYTFQGIGNTEIKVLNITLDLHQPRLAGQSHADQDGQAVFEINTLPVIFKNKTVHLQAAQQRRISQMTRREIQ